jgi:hypothetical protein
VVRSPDLNPVIIIEIIEKENTCRGSLRVLDKGAVHFPCFTGLLPEEQVPQLVNKRRSENLPAQRGGKVVFLLIV